MPQILARIKPPKFPKKDFNVTKYGAVADGKTDCTEAFRKAIEACSKAGGGRVVVPKGEFLTGAIHLKINVNLHVSKGATLKFSTDEDKYPIVHTRWEGMELMHYSALIYAYEQDEYRRHGRGHARRAGQRALLEMARQRALRRETGRSEPAAGARQAVRNDGRKCARSSRVFSARAAICGPISFSLINAKMC